MLISRTEAEPMGKEILYVHICPGDLLRFLRRRIDIQHVANVSKSRVKEIGTLCDRRARLQYHDTLASINRRFCLKAFLCLNLEPSFLKQHAKVISKVIVGFQCTCIVCHNLRINYQSWSSILHCYALVAARVRPSAATRVNKVSVTLTSEAPQPKLAKRTQELTST